jgi:haloalkane dehalogenase
MVSSLRKEKFRQYTLAFEGNPLVAIRDDLKAFTNPARIVWALTDPFFAVQWADWLDRTLPRSRGVRRLESANLVFPEEMPDIIAQEARGLWGILQELVTGDV